MNIENIGEELEGLIKKFELTKSCLKLNENQTKLNALLKERDSLTFWNNLDYAMQTKIYKICFLQCKHYKHKLLS